MSEATPDRPAPAASSRDDELPDPRLAPLVPPEPEHQAPPRLAAMKAMGGVGTLGLEVALSVMVGLFGGQWLDGRLGTGPWLTALGFGFGVAAAARAILRQVRRMKIEAAREEAAEGNPTPLWETAGERAQRDADDARAAQQDAGRRRATEDDR